MLELKVGFAHWLFKFPWCIGLTGVCVCVHVCERVCVCVCVGFLRQVLLDSVLKLFYGRWFWNAFSHEGRYKETLTAKPTSKNLISMTHSKITSYPRPWTILIYFKHKQILNILSYACIYHNYWWVTLYALWFDYWYTDNTWQPILVISNYIYMVTLSVTQLTVLVQ